ncbi:hypothetical protein BX600DRAFT_447057 [Xylariales sp. PMI_506]|nr:hypothetical protein BX600DRAFT_447057 [Xylariales sp. PMI_506]
MEASKALRDSVKDDASAIAFGQGSARTLPMKVIVCGLGRTGTTSLRTALDILGYRSYHSTDLWMDSKKNVEKWNIAFDWKYNGKGQPFTRLEWDEILGDYMSTIDAPAQFFAAELAEAYPDAKVVVLNRDFDSWFDSCVAALGGRGNGLSWIYRLFFFWDARVLTLSRYMDKKQHQVWGFEWLEPGARDKARDFFNDYYADFRARIPEPRRLDYSVKEGWGPLCRHLGVDVPTVAVYGDDGENGVAERVQVPFPRTNDAQEFKQKVGRLMSVALREAMESWAKAILMTFVIGYGTAPYVAPQISRLYPVVLGLIKKGLRS